MHVPVGGFPDGSVIKNLPADARDTRDTGSIPGLGRSPRVGNGNPLQYSCLGNPIDRGAWGATLQGVAKSCIWPSDRACARGYVRTHMFLLREKSLIHILSPLRK